MPIETMPQAELRSRLARQGAFPLLNLRSVSEQ